MSVHDHHNDPNDPVNQPPRRSRSVDPDGRPLATTGRRVAGSEGMGPGAWIAALVLLLAVIGGIIYSMSDRTTTATNTGASPAGSTTGAGSNPGTPRTTTGTATQTTPPAAPAPSR